MTRLWIFAVLCGLAGITEAASVRLEKVSGGYQLMRDGQPYFIKGAGGKNNLDVLAACGGNSIRTWGTDNLEPLLDEAHRNGLTVTIGFWVGHERHGFNYNDANAVREQMEKARAAVQRYKDHPALLMWCMGNEMEADGKNEAIWKAINDLAKMCKQVDPNHPVMTVIAELGEPKVAMFNQHCPDVDVLGINTYGGVQSIGERYRKAGGTKPYAVTEFGPPGQWEIPVLSIDTISEFNSTKKAEWYANGYRDGILKERPLCIGSYVFVWGFKQEATATWYGLFLKDGARLGAVEAMIKAWGGPAPANRCPLISDVKLARDDGWKPGEELVAKIEVSDPDGDALTTKWILRRDSKNLATGGDDQADEPEFPEAIVASAPGQATVRIPAGGGLYRLFAYTYDGKGNAAVANVPFRVEGPFVRPPAPRAHVPFHLYGDDVKSDPFIPSGYMGDYAAIKMEADSRNNPASGATCLRVSFGPSAGWGGVVWQSPANDWGEQAGGYNLSDANVLVFKARGETGREVIGAGVGIIGPDKPYADSAMVSKKDIALSTEWQEFRIPLSGQNLSAIKSGFYWTTGGKTEPVVFYLDDIAFQNDPQAPSAGTVTYPNNPPAVGGAPSSPAPVAAPAAASASAGGAAVLAVYREAGDRLPYIPSGYMGDVAAITMDDKSATQPHSGATCLRIGFAKPDGWGGVVWQDPVNDWGEKPGGYDLTGATALEFWARGEAGGETLSFGFGIVGLDKPFGDTAKGELKGVVLTTEWKKYSIPVAGNLSRIKSGFSWVIHGQGRPVVFFLDDIQYVGTGAAAKSSAQPSGKAGPGRTATLPFAVDAEGAYIPSGYMGNYGAIKMDGQSTEQPHSGATCTRVDYTAVDNWGGVVWQNPHNDWGDQPGGFNLTGAQALTFWARGAAGGEKMAFGFGVIGADKPFSDSGKGEMKDVVLSTEWTSYCIPLTGKDLSRIKSGFFWSLGGQGKPVTFYLDDIQYVSTACP